MSDEKPTIISDDDWKAQVEREKAGGDDGPEDTTPVADATAGAERPPAASLEGVVMMFFSQCLMSLGQLPGPDGKPGDVNKPYAKFFIDSLELAQSKMDGNLSDEEAKMIADALHAMRMAFVDVK